MRLRVARIITTVFVLAVSVLLLTGCAPDDDPGSSIRDTRIDWPEWDQIRRVITLADYNTRIVVMGTMLLGLAAGVVGTYMLLRKRALIGDAVSHATLPGIGIAFILMVQFGGNGKYLPGLLLGATITGLIGVGFILLIKGMTRIKEDAALGIVLSVFFGLGVAVLGVIQSMQQGNAAGLESFIYGKTASMIKSDVILIASVALVVIFLSMLLYKEFAILCFDQAFARAQGWPVTLIDIVMMGLGDRRFGDWSPGGGVDSDDRPADHSPRRGKILDGSAVGHADHFRGGGSDERHAGLSLQRASASTSRRGDNRGGRGHDFYLQHDLWLATGNADSRD